MSLSNIKKMQAEKGFTIVELLIVIVVIGILAAIVIVAYNGIQDRSKNTKYQTDATALQKGAEAVNADLGSYPTGTDAATLTTSFNSSATFKVPSGVGVAYVTAAPDDADAITAADGTTRTYSVDPCTSGGVKIFYPVRGGSLATLSVGNTTAGC